MPTPALVLLGLLLAADAPAADLTPVKCQACDGWNQPRAPFRIHGQSHYVGVQGLGAVLIETARGLILIDGGLPQSVPLILANMKTLGFRIEDVKWILSSHPHYDHTGGVAALARLSGARVASSPAAAEVLRAGMVKDDDPQVGYGEGMRFPPVPGKLVELRDGATIRLGEVSLKVHHTPGHSPGGTTWTWRSCQREGKKPGRCLNLVYADSLNASSSPGFRFSDDPPRVAQLRRTIAKVRRLPCDILVSAHPNLSGVFERQAAREGPGAKPDPMIDPQACRRYADAAVTRLDKRLADEAAAQAARKPDAAP